MADYRAGDYESALVNLAGAKVDESDYLDLAYILGLCHVRMARYDEALLYLEQIVTSGLKGPRTNQCRLTLAYVYAVTGRSKLAEYELRILAEEKNISAQTCAAYAYVHWMQGRIDDALVWYAKALEADPENLNALNGYGYLLACTGNDLKKALTCCRKAHSGNPANPAYADSLGWTYFRMGLLSDARQYLESAAELLADHPEVRKHLEQLKKAVAS
jgi:tetratricopeptide (TPR) repeat protein